MLQQDFVPPTKEVAQRETSKRIKALENFLPRIKPAITSLTVTGSMASGQNYAVTEKSDLDMQLTVTKESIKSLKEINIFQNDNFDKSLDAYLNDLIKQFSFSIEIDGIAHECHFWDEQAYIDAMEMKTEFTKRIRTSNSTQAIDYGFAFDGSQDAYDCPTEEIDGKFISVLPTYRYVDSKLYLCRPVTSLLSTPLVLLGSEMLSSHIDNTWSIVVNHLVKEAGNKLNLQKHNILNALPSKFKMSQESKDLILERTKKELDKIGVKYQL